MRFDELILRRFGHFTDFELNFGQQTPGEPDLHVLYGPNEAGKSTTLAAITDLLYGIQRQSPWNFLHAYDVLELDATLTQNDTSIQLKRFKNHWANASDVRMERFPLDLQGLSRDDYTRRFSFDEQTLQAGGEQILNSDGDVGQALFSASAGLANLKEQIDDALSDANAFWMPRKRANLLVTDLKTALLENKKQMDLIKLDAPKWKKRCDNLEHATLRRDKHRQRLEELRQSLRLLEKRQSAQTLATHYRKLTEQRDALAVESVVSLEHPFAANFLTANAARTLLDRTREQLENCRIAQASRAVLETRQEELQQQLEACQPTAKAQTLIQAADRIRTLTEENSAVYEWQQQQQQYQATITRYAAELDSARQRLGIAADTPLENKLPGESLLAELQALLDEEQGLSASVQHAQEELNNLEALPHEDRGTNGSRVADTEAPDLDVAAELLRSIQQEGLSNQLVTAQDALLESQHVLHTKLDRIGLSMEQANQLDLPDASWLNGKLDELADWRQQIKQLNKNNDTLTREITDKQARCTELTLAGALDVTQLSDAKTARDQHWSQHSQALDEQQTHTELQKSARLFEKAMGAHDALLQQAANSNQASAELQMLQAQLARQQQERQALSDQQLPEKQQQQQHCIALLKSRVTGFYDAETIESDLLRERHAQIVQLVAEQDTLHTQRLQLQKLKHKAAEQARKLLHMLAPLQAPARLEALSRLELDDLLTQTGHRLESLKADRAQQRESERALSVLVKSHALRRQQLTDAEQALTSWQQRWHSLTHDTLFSEMPLPQARDSLAWVASLPPLLNSHRDASHNLEKLSGRLSTREAAIVQLMKELDETSLPQAMQNLEAAIQQAQSHTALQAQLKTLQQKMEKSSLHHAASQQAVTTLRQTLSVESDDALLVVLTRTEQHRTLHDRCLETLAQLRDISDVGSGEEQIERLCQEHDVDTLEQQLLDLNAQLTEASTAYDESSEAWALANRELEDIGDESEYAHLNQERQNLILQTMDLARQCAIARTGQKVLNAAVSRFRQEHQSVILSEAQQAFTTLTGGRYKQLLPRDDGNGNERLFVIDQQEKARAVTELSTGTRYQLYLALRAAAHADYATQRPPLPFVADDIMESFDDERSSAAFEVLARMAKKGQVIYLTHHQHLLDLAREVVGKDRVHIHYFQ